MCRFFAVRTLFTGPLVFKIDEEGTTLILPLEGPSFRPATGRYWGKHASGSPWLAEALLGSLQIDAEAVRRLSGRFAREVLRRLPEHAWAMGADFVREWVSWSLYMDGFTGSE